MYHTFRQEGGEHTADRVAGSEWAGLTRLEKPTNADCHYFSLYEYRKTTVVITDIYKHVQVFKKKTHQFCVLFYAYVIPSFFFLLFFK